MGGSFSSTIWVEEFIWGGNGMAVGEGELAKVREIKRALNHIFSEELEE